MKIHHLSWFFIMISLRVPRRNSRNMFHISIKETHKQTHVLMAKFQCFDGKNGVSSLLGASLRAEEALRQRLLALSLTQATSGVAVSWQQALEQLKWLRPGDEVPELRLGRFLGKLWDLSRNVGAYWIDGGFTTG